jgi:NAD(P)H-dependent FMN reductase
MRQPKILAFAGSTRTGSYNKQLIRVAAEGARAAGAEVTLIDLRDFPMALFDEDLERENGLPASARELKALFCEHEGLLISSPEYNSSITGVLKNALDWVSRTETEDEPSLLAFCGKTAAIMSASPGGLGGIRGLVHLRALLGNIGVLVLPDQVTISAAHSAFDSEGGLTDQRKSAQVTDLGKALADTVAKLRT